ncbi:MarR family transcriptional regulator [Peribacillus loiseleuriae]
MKALANKLYLDISTVSRQTAAMEQNGMCARFLTHRMADPISIKLPI